MSGELLQNLAVAAIVLAAAGFLVWRRMRRKARPSPLCGDCPACATAEQEKADWGLLADAGPRARRGAKPRRIAGPRHP